MKKIYIAFFLSIFFGCTDNFEELNTPSDQLVAENLNVGQIGQAFAKVQFNTVNVANYEVSQNLFADLFSQYTALIQPNFHSDRYVDVGSWSNTNFVRFYRDVARELSFIEKFTESNALEGELALIKIWKVFAFHRLTDYYGPIPYFEVGEGGRSVPYNSQESIYKDFFNVLDEAASTLEQHQGKFFFGRDDLLFGGDVDKWLIFANSLRLRLALRIKYVEPNLAQQEAEKAVNSGVIISSEDNAVVKTNEISLHSLGRISNYNNWRMSTSMESILVGYEDPRLDAFWNPVLEDNRNDGRKFHGVRNGLPISDMNKVEQGVTHSKIDNLWWRLEDGGENPPYQVIRAEEVYFLRAEGALEGWNMRGTAQELYEKGIETSILSRTNVPIEEVEKYINSNNIPVSINDKWNTPAVSNIPVAFEVDGTKERQLEQVGTQKWIALFPNGWEAWAEMRRTGYPRYLPRLQSDNPDVPADQMIRRLTYVDSEFASNSEAVDAALELPELANNGGDKNNTRLWWDNK